MAIAATESGSLTNDGPDDLVVCESCGLVNVALTDEMRQLREESEALRGELASKAVAVRRLRGEQARDIQLHARYGDAIDVLEHWRKVLAPRTKELNGPRLRNVISRLEHGYSVEDLKQAVDGYAVEPLAFKGTTYHDAELLFRDAKHVDDGIRRFARAASPEPTLAPSVVHWRQVYRENRDLIVRFLRAEFGGPVQESGMLLWPCPMCLSDPACTLRVSAEARFSFLAECSRCGATDKSLLQLAAER